MSSWGCPHEIGGNCARINNVPCDPGMKGCVLFGRFVWADETKNRPGKTRDSNQMPEAACFADEGRQHKGDSK